MAEEKDQHDKTEEPTQKRLEEARKRGEVAKTPDLPTWMSLAAASGVVIMAGGWLARDLMTALLPFIARPDQIDLNNGGAIWVMRKCLLAAAPVMMVLGASAVAGVAGNLVQTGFVLSGEKMKPDFSKLNPMNGFKRLFGIDALVQFAKSLLKVGVIALVCYTTLKPHWQEFVGLVELDPVSMMALAIAVLKALFFAVLGVLGVTAIADWFWQRFRFMQKMRMSREELKEETKQSEGDPHIRARLRQIRMERSRRRMMQNVPKATVVITNPTHYAVALYYRDGETAAPQCLAKGVDAVAFRIREVAAEAGVPIVEDPPLARALFATVDVDQVIPQQHYEAVAKVIGFILNQARRKARAAWR